MDETETKRINPFVAGAAAAVVIVSLVAIGALAGRTPLVRSQNSQEAQPSAEIQVEAARSVPRSERAAATQLCGTCGTVESVRMLEIKSGTPRAGEVASGAVRGVVGTQTVYRVTIRMDDGSYRTISQPIEPGYAAGEKVRIIDGSVVARE